MLGILEQLGGNAGSGSLPSRNQLVGVPLLESSPTGTDSQIIISLDLHIFSPRAL